MDFASVVFYFLAAILLLSALRVITAKNPVHAAMALVLAFFTAAGVWLLLEAEFLAITLVLVYVGAVMVLFLFVVMMLDINQDEMRAGFWKHLPLAGLVGALIALEMAAVLLGGFKVSVAKEMPPEVLAMGNSKALGVEIYTHYLYPLQVAAVLLLVAIIAAIALTLRARKDSKFQDPSVQLKAKKADRVRLLKMDAVKPTPSQQQEGSS